MSEIPHPDCGYCGNDDCPLCGECESEGVVVRIERGWMCQRAKGVASGEYVYMVETTEFVEPGRYRLTRIEEGEGKG